MNYWNLSTTAFELVQACLVWGSVFRLTDERQVKGVLGGYFVFSALWSVQAIGYYWSHDDRWSAIACAFRALGLVFWSLLWLYFRRTEKPAKIYPLRRTR